MQRILSVAMALLLLVSGAVLTQRDGWFERFTVEPEPASTDPLTPWQHGEENWLVLVVDFEDATTQSTGLGVAQAVSLMEGEIVPYLSMMSGDADVNFTVHPEVLRAPEPSTAYGKDGSAGRDFSNDGTFLPAMLVSELVQSLTDDVAWSDHDLVDDGTVDRLLVLHTSRGQEAGAGGNDRIWSHFTHLMEPVRVAPGIDVAHYAMATMRGGTGASGTVVHEMLHQIGAVDLYPVHDPAWSGTWHGLGDWDIMASGNWNGNGVWPALPTAASMQLMGLDTSSNVVLDFPVQRDGVCLGPTLDLTPRHEGGASLRVDLTEQQRVFIELKGGNTYDDRLPGSGVLVTLLDDAAGNPANNDVNVDPGRPWLRVVEADADDGLLTGQDDGTEGDTFDIGDTFGAEGVVLRDHRGLKVPWTAEIVPDVEGNGTAVAFSAPNCGHGLELDVPPYGLRVNANEALELQLINNDAPCTLSGSLRTDLGGVVTFASELLDEGAHAVELQAETTLVGDAVDRLSGTLECAGTLLDLDVPLTVLNRIPNDDAVVETIHVTESQRIDVDVSSTGHGPSRYTVLIEGPLSRIATASNSVTLDSDVQTLAIDIEPAGLLQDGMLVRGEIHLVDLDGGRTVLPVTLTAEGDKTTVDRLRQPETAVGLCMVLIGLSMLWPRRSAPPINVPPTSTPSSVKAKTVTHDPWGRPLDLHDVVEQDDQGVPVERPSIDQQPP